MTWRELKELIDTRLAELGADEDVEIWYFDFSFPNINHESTTPHVSIDEHSGLAVG